MGVAYYDNDATNNSGAYRTTEGVDLENSNGSIHISWSNGGEWTKYTINVTQTGTYDISIPVSTGNGASGALFLTFDDVYNYPIASINTGGWNVYQSLTVNNVGLTAGTHVMTLNIVGNINVDKFTFVKKSDIIVDNQELIDFENVSVYPNPSEGVFYVNASAEGEMQIFDIKGLQIYSGSLNKNTNVIDLTASPAGMYFSKIMINGEVYRLKLIKK